MTWLLIAAIIMGYGYLKYRFPNFFTLTPYLVAFWALLVVIWEGVLTLVGYEASFTEASLGVLVVGAIIWFASSDVAWVIVRTREAWVRRFQRCVSCDNKEVITESIRDIFDCGTPDGNLIRLSATVDMHTCCQCGFMFTGIHAERMRDEAYKKYLKQIKREV